MRPLLLRAHCLYFVVFAALWAGSLQAQTPVSRDVPAAYRELIEHRLTKVEDLLKDGHPASKDSVDGEVLLREYLYWVDEDGKSHQIVHTVYHAHTQDGVEAMAQDRFAFDAKLNRVHLAQARTIGADGEIKAVAENAAFIERGRQESATQLYNSDHSVVVIYPDVKVGSLVETIIVYEEIEQQIPGEFTAVLGFATGWPVTHDRREIDLPTPLYEKLHQQILGKDVPEMQVVGHEHGRTRLRWSADHLERGFSERSEAPSTQTGPCVLLSTLPDWDAFTKWFSGVLAERSELSDALKQKVDHWTKGLDSDEQILRVLFEKAANDVRYTGLEFGSSGLRPYSCNTVWDNQYGDCKDKSNLLRAMLAHKDINSYLTLVQTSHAGLVPKGVADFRRFDHAILAVELKPGEWTFCDPTIEHGRPGLLSPSSSERDVLAVYGERAQWLRTPASTNCHYRYTLELDLSDSYQITGSLDSTGSGYYAISELARHRGAGRDAALANLQDLVGAFFPGAWAIDYLSDQAQPATAPESVTNRTYLATPALQTDSAERLHIPFPMPRGLLYDYDHTEKRHTDYYQWPETTEITLVLRLPAGLAPASLPAKLESVNPYYAAQGQWTFDASTQSLSATLTTTTGRAVIPKNHVATALETTRALTTWVQAPVILEPTRPKENAADQRQEFTLPTANGQLAYIDARFPLSGDHNARRQQLTAVRTAYPDDAAIQYQARHELAMVDFYATRYDEAIAAWHDLTDTTPEGVSNASAHFSRYMLAQAHAERGTYDEALATLLPLLEDDGVSEYRLGWSLTCAGEYALHGTSQDLAEGFMNRALEIDGAHSVRADALRFVLQCFRGDKTAATQWLTAAMARPLTGFEPAMREVYTIFAEFSPEELAQDALLLAAQVIDAACAAPVDAANEESQTFASGYPPYLKSMHAARHANLVLGPQLENFVTTHLERLTAYGPALDPMATATAAAHEARIEQLMEADDPQTVAAIAHYISHHPCSDLPEQLWRMAAFVSSSEIQHPQDHPLTPELIALGEQIPFSNDNRWEFDFIRAKWQSHHEQWQQCIELFETQRAHPEFNAGYRTSSLYQQGQCHEKLGDWENAVDCYLQLKELRATAPTAAIALMRAGVLQARDGQHDAALATWRLLHDVPEPVITRSEAQIDLNEAIALSRRPQELLAYWKAADNWWKNVARRQLAAAGIPLKNQTIEPYLSTTAPAIEAAVLETAQGNDAKAYLAALLPLIDYLRWSPNGLEVLHNQFGVAAISNNPRMKKHTDALAQPIAAAVADFGDPELTPFAQRLAVALLIDVAEPARALPLARDYVGQINAYDRDHTERLAWLYLIAGIQSGDDLERATTTAMQVWQNGITAMDPHQFGNTLGWALKELGRNDQALSVAQTALKMQTSSPTYTKLLNDLVHTIQMEAKSSHELNTALLEWATQNRPPWYELVTAASPDTLDSADTAPTLKFHLEQICDETIPTAERLTAWRLAVTAFAHEQPQWEGFVDTISQAAALETIPTTTRTSLVWRAYTHACYQGQPRAARKLRNLPIFQQIDASILSDLSPRLMDHAAAVRYRDGDQHLANIDSLTKASEIDNALYELITTELRGLWMTDGFDAGDDVINSVKSWKLTNDSFAHRIGVQIRMRQSSNQFKQTLSLADAWAALLQPQLEMAAKHAPRDWRDWRAMPTLTSGLQFTGLDRKTIDGILAKRILERSMIDANEHLSQFLISSGLWPSPDQPNAGETYAAALTSLLDSKLEPAILAESLMAFSSIVPRERSIRKRLADVLEPHTKSNEGDLRALITILRTMFQACAGERPALESLEPLCGSVFGEMIALNLQPTLAQAYGDEATRAKALKSLRETAPQRLYSELGMLMALSVYTRTPVTEVAAGLELQPLTTTMDACWYGAPESFATLIPLAILSGRHAEIPAELMPWLVARTDATKATYLRAMAAWLDGDFETMLKHTSAHRGIDLKNSHLIHAVALAGAGKTDEARALLQQLTVDAYLDCDDWIAAQMMLQSLEQNTTAK